MLEGRQRIPSKLQAALACAIAVASLLISAPGSNAAEKLIESFEPAKTILVFGHQDDDLLWMLPFWPQVHRFVAGALPKTPGLEFVVHKHQTYFANNPPYIPYEDQWVAPWGKISDCAYKVHFISSTIDWCKDEPIPSDLSAKYLDPSVDDRVPHPYEVSRAKALFEPIMRDPAVETIITHNPWGAYGHPHHRVVSQAVRELAVKYNQDVWVLGSKILLDTPPNYYNDLPLIASLDHTYGIFPAKRFDDLVRLYGGSWAVENGWWTGAPYDPKVDGGKHIYFRVVENGFDRSFLIPELSDAYLAVMKSYFKTKTHPLPQPSPPRITIRTLRFGPTRIRSFAAIIDGKLQIFQIGKQKILRTGRVANEIVAGDFDGQPGDELVIATSSPAPGTVLYSKDGIVWEAVPGAKLHEIDAGDLNGDGHMDLIGIDEDNGEIKWTPSLTNPKWKTLSKTAVELATGRFSKDSPNVDGVAIVSLEDRGIYVSEDLETWKPVPGHAGDIFTGDFDASGRDGLLVHNGVSRSLWVTDDFEKWRWVPGECNRVATGRFDGDRQTDIACVNDSTGNVYKTTDLGQSWTNLKGVFDEIAAGELHPDGLDDLVGINRNPNQVGTRGDGPAWVCYSPAQGMAGGPCPAP